MSIEKVTMFVVKCDRCGKTTADWPDCEFSAWSDVTGAQEDADASDWEVIGDKDCCPDCWKTIRQ